MGGLQVLSAPLVAHLARSTEVEAFVARSEHAVNYSSLAASPTRTVNDDVILGYWLSDAQLRRGLPNISYVFINERATNLECDVRDCAARRICGQYRLASNRSVLIHNLKSATQLTYVWGVLKGWSAHDVDACKRFRAGPTGARASLAPGRQWLAHVRGASEGRT